MRPSQSAFSSELGLGFQFSGHLRPQAAIFAILRFDGLGSTCSCFDKLTMSGLGETLPSSWGPSRAIAYQLNSDAQPCGTGINGVSQSAFSSEPGLGVQYSRLFADTSGHFSNPVFRWVNGSICSWFDKLSMNNRRNNRGHCRVVRGSNQC